MKIAICVSGHVRRFNEYLTSLNTLTKDKNHEYDIFLSTWDIKNSPNSHSYIRRGYNDFDYFNINDILEIYNPKSYLVEKNNDYAFNQFSKYSGTNNPIAVFSQFYKINQVSKLMDDYKNSNNIIYDLVIRTRFDLKIKDDFNINNYFNDYFNIEEDNCGENWCSDKFSISNYKNHMIFSNFYNNLENLMINNHNNIPEILLDKWLKINNVNKLKHESIIERFG